MGNTGISLNSVAVQIFNIKCVIYWGSSAWRLSCNNITRNVLIIFTTQQWPQTTSDPPVIDTRESQKSMFVVIKTWIRPQEEEETDPDCPMFIVHSFVLSCSPVVQTTTHSLPSLYAAVPWLWLSCCQCWPRYQRYFSKMKIRYKATD